MTVNGLIASRVSSPADDTLDLFGVVFGVRPASFPFEMDLDVCYRIDFEDYETVGSYDFGVVLIAPNFEWSLCSSETIRFLAGHRQRSSKLLRMALLPTYTLQTHGRYRVCLVCNSVVVHSLDLVVREPSSL